MYVAFLRGINVGGKNRLPMKRLAAHLEGLGATGVRTLLQSGNAVFEAPADARGDLAERLSSAIEAEHGFRPRTLILSAAELGRAAAANPFPAAGAEPKSLHLFFLLATSEAPDLARLEAVRAPTEAYALRGDVFYLHAPDGIGRSKLAASVDRALGVETTARNGLTVRKMLALTGSGGGA